MTRPPDPGEPRAGTLLLAGALILAVGMYLGWSLQIWKGCP